MDNNNNNNTGITLTDVRYEAMNAIRGLKDKTIDVRTAKEINGMLNVIINVAKTQVDFIRVIPAKIKDTMSEDTIQAMAGTLVDRDKELDVSLKQIEEKNKSVKLS